MCVCMSADDIAGTGESYQHRGSVGAQRQCNKQDDSRGVAGCVTQLLQPLLHIRAAKKKLFFVENNATLCGFKQ